MGHKHWEPSQCQMDCAAAIVLSCRIARERGVRKVLKQAWNAETGAGKSHIINTIVMMTDLEQYDENLPTNVHVLCHNKKLADRDVKDHAKCHE